MSDAGGEIMMRCEGESELCGEWREGGEEGGRRGKKKKKKEEEEQAANRW